MWLNNN